MLYLDLYSSNQFHVIMCRTSRIKCLYFSITRKRWNSFCSCHIASCRSTTTIDSWTVLTQFPWFISQEKLKSKREIDWPSLKPCLYKRRWGQETVLSRRPCSLSCSKLNSHPSNCFSMQCVLNCWYALVPWTCYFWGVLTLYLYLVQCPGIKSNLSY